MQRMGTDNPAPRLMIVGPGELHDSELEVLGTQLQAHYGDRWVAQHAELMDSLRTFLGCSQDPYVIPGSGSLALEAAFLNLFEPGARVVVADTGYFGNRLIEVATALGLDLKVVPVEVGSLADPQILADAVKQHSASGLAICHVDTSTGIRHPVQEISQAVRAHGAVTLVDGIASVGGEHCDIDRMQLDCVVTGSQKGLEAPPGLGIVALGDAGQERVSARSKPVSSFYLDFARWDWYRREWPHHPHPVTMPVSLMLALNSSIQRILEVGLDETIQRKHQLATLVRTSLEQLGMAPVAPAQAQAGMIVAVRTARAPEIVSAVLKEGIQIAGGLAPLAGQAIRVGIIGATANEAMIQSTLDAIERAVS
jgi:alanine-glyoxylate transaminase / serine-glyoxylate transaminase / serine-pyruvate transaminase